MAGQPSEMNTAFGTIVDRWFHTSTSILSPVSRYRCAMLILFAALCPELKAPQKDFQIMFQDETHSRCSTDPAFMRRGIHEFA